MKFEELFQLIQESAKVGVAEYVDRLKYAYLIIFNLESEDIIDKTGREITPPEYQHCYYKTKIEILYRGKHFKIFHDLLHFKVSPKELYNKHDYNSIQHQPIIDDFLKREHPLVLTRFKIFEVTETEDRFGLNDEKMLEEETVNGGIKDVVTRIKQIIDEGREGDSDSDLPTPKSPEKQLVPV
jgi:hypothetical protein